MRKLVISPDGVNYEPMTESEIEALNAKVIPFHFDRNFRLVISTEVQDRLIKEKALNDISGKFPIAAFLLNHMKERSFETAFDSENTYVYLDNINPEHVPYINMYGIIIEEK